MSIRIDQLASTALPSTDHVLPAMKDGLSVKLTVGQLLGLLVDAAPGTLDTLNELAAALGDDPNFAASVASQLAQKLDKSGGTLTGDLNLGTHVLKNGLLDDGLLLANAASPTKRARLSAAGVTAGQSRVISLPDRDLTLNPAWELIDDATIASAVAWTKTGLSAYRRLRFSMFLDMVSAAEAINFQVSTDNGATWVSANYFFQYWVLSGSTSTGVNMTTGVASLPASAGGNKLQFGSYGMIATMTVENFNLAERMLWTFDGGVPANTPSTIFTISKLWGGLDATVARSAVRISSAQNFKGRIMLEGMR